MIKRTINPSKSNSFFLFGPRGSGKTTLLQELFSEAETLYINLLNIDLYDELMLDPIKFESIILAKENISKRVLVDEIQKIPKLLDLVHKHIQKNKRQFILTGSSARKLKQSGTNLLAGRAFVYHLYPFSSLEISDAVDLKYLLEWGGLPEVFSKQNNLDRREFLSSYVQTYLQKEIQEEQWVKNLMPFRKFLSVAAQMNGKIINKSKMAREIGINDVTVQNYFEILEDTLIGFMLPAFSKSVRKAQRLMPKFYLIDTGIKRALERTLTVELVPQTSAYGEAFEHWVILEILKNINYLRLDWQLSYLCTKDDLEIDLIIDRPGMKTLLIEIKSKTNVSESDVKSLELLGDDIDRKAERWLLSNDLNSKKFGKTEAVHWLKAIHTWFKI